MIYKKSVNEVFDEFQTNECGLTNDEARIRLEKYGQNALKEKKAKPIWKKILDQFKSPLIYILLIASIFTVIVGKYIDTGVILAVVIINAVVGFFQEYKAEKAMQAIRELAAPKAIVVRDCNEDKIDSDEIVPGDVIVLSAGNKIPADVRIFEEKELEIDESMFTGESLPAQKHINTIEKNNIPIADQTNMAFMGTIITQGRGRGVVVKTGENTELGKISREVKTTEKEETPLQKRLGEFSRKIGIAALVFAFIVFLLGLILGHPVVEMILFGISIAVAIVPEGLPIVITITMAVGLKRMAEKNAIIRKLIAVETLGSCNYICSDKTGTITENRMTVTRTFANGKEFEFTGTGYEPTGNVLLNKEKIQKDDDLNRLLLTGLLCNTAELYEEKGEWAIEGDPTEGALLVAAKKYGLNIEKNEYKFQLVDEIPFSSKRQYMATVYSDENSNTIYVKGAPEKILEFSNNKDNQALTSQYSHMAKSGLRVLGFGIKKLDSYSDEIDLEHESTHNLEFVGFQGIIDPPRESAIKAIDGAHKAGINVVMITGDHIVTAKAIATKVGILNGGKVMTGQELDQCGEDFLNKCVETVYVYARVSPSHKFKIVEALQNRGNTVAVTGDGINDAPALKKSNIGIAMGKVGTDVAKEASEMVLKDDNFATIFEAVKIGRVIFDNIRKVITFLLASSIGIPLTIIASIILTLPLPFLATQVLWVNLVTNGFQDISLAYEPGEKDIDKRKPRDPKENVINKPILKRVVLTGTIYTVGILTMFWYVLNQGASIEYARTTALNTIVFFQFFNVWNSRSFNKSIFQVNPFSNKPLLAAVTVSIFAQIAVLTFEPLHIAFQTTKLDAATWLQTILVAFSIIIVVEIDKLISSKYSKVT